jgi:hypothetical protein
VRVLLLAVLISLGVTAAPGVATAAWPNDPTVNVPVCVLGGTQANEVIVPDGSGGAIVAWSDLRSVAYDLYAQRLSPTGVALWTTNGVPFCTATGGQYLYTAVADGAGGAIFAWTDLRGGSQDLYAQRIDASGTALWASDGVPVCLATGSQTDVVVESDGAGGAVFAWIDPRGGANDVYAQRISAGGSALWATDGVAVCTATGAQSNVRLVADGTGGAIVCWDDGRSGSYDIYAQRIASNGSVAWVANGALVCGAVNNQYGPRPVGDGGGGVIVAWQDYRSGNYDVYAQRLNSSGVAQWTADGVALCTASGSQTVVRAVPDRAAGVIVTWSDPRNGITDVYAQRVSSGGVPAWTADGVPVAVGGAAKTPTQLVAVDGVEGAIVGWYDARTGNNDLYVQRIDGTGTVRWASTGVALCTHPVSQTTMVLAPDGAGGVIGAWDDNRVGLSTDIRAQRVDGFGQRGAQPTITRVRDVPNDQGGQVKLEWSASPIDAYPDYAIDSYWVLRSVPPNGAVRAARVMRDAGETPVPGIRDVLVTGAAGAQTAWEYVSSMPAFHVASYSAVVPTTSDSMAGSNPKTLFMVMARAPGGTAWWFSDPDSGYSVDDLAPAMPAPFAATYAGGVAALHWGANREADLAGYRVYRGTTPDFAPGPATFVAAIPDTGMVDAAGGPYYYRVTAVDIHGNEGPAAFALPSGTTGLPGATAAPRALAPVWPNPTRGGAEVRWSLARAGVTRLSVIDVAGRRVRTLEAGVREAGAHATRWDGCDDAGRPVAAGLHVVVLEAEGRVLRTRVVTLR